MHANGQALLSSVPFLHFFFDAAIFFSFLAAVSFSADGLPSRGLPFLLSFRWESPVSLFASYSDAAGDAACFLSASVNIFLFFFPCCCVSLIVASFATGVIVSVTFCRFPRFSLSIDANSTCHFIFFNTLVFLCIFTLTPLDVLSTCIRSRIQRREL